MTIAVSAKLKAGQCVGTEVYIDEVDDVVVDDTIVKVADGSAEDESKRDAGGREARQQVRINA